jgi:Cys-rich repeat protein
MLMDLFLACSLRGPDGPGDHDTTSSAPDDSTPGSTDDSTAPEKKKYDCVAVDQVAPKGSAPSGYEYCAVDATTGFYHRVKAVDVAVNPYGDPDDACNPEGMAAECKTNADCGKGSVCEYDGIWGGCDCVDKCTTDSDCGAGFACIPNLVSLEKHKSGMTGFDQCVSAECRTDADCPSGWCVLPWSDCGPPFVGGLRCFSAEDECRTASDCSDGKECYSTDGKPFSCDYYWSCQ